jgi:hypothetical protein
MKKIMISLLMVAATVNAMAITYTGKAKLTLTSSDNQSCSMTIAESEDLAAGLNPGYYAELNEEGKEVLMYVDFGGKKYQHFASNAATMADLQLGIKTNAATSYTLTASNVSGSAPLKIRIAGVEYSISAGMSEVINLPASSVLPAAGDEADYKVQPAPLAKGICFNYEKLELVKYNGAKVEVFAKDAVAPAVTENVPSDAKYVIDLSAQAKGRYSVKIDLDGDNAADEEYQIDVKPAVTVVP